MLKNGTRRRAGSIAVPAMTALGLILAGATGIALADAKTDSLIKQRQDDMKAMGGTFKVVVPIVKGENTNVADAVESAMKVNQLAMKIPANFPAGSGREASTNTRAKPEIWSKRAEFETAAEKLARESAKLAEVAKTNDLEAFRAQFKTYVAACGGCHEGPPEKGGKFRFEKQQ